jgi:activating signal cointegrator complex subunit 2
MKADILRRAEAISDDDDDEELEFEGGGHAKNSIVLAYDDEDLDGVTRSNVKIGGDGEESEDGENDEGGGTEREVVQKAQTPETILELVYIRDPKLFDRDAGTRRSKTREELRVQTGNFYYMSMYRWLNPAFSIQDGETSRSRGGRSCWSVMQVLPYF